MIGHVGLGREAESGALRAFVEIAGLMMEKTPRNDN
jgi:hypothetical protein